MRQRVTEDREFPKFPIGPILAFYGGADVDPDMGWRKYNCPFGELHSSGDDNSASASVNTVINVFVCHGCGIKGDAVQVIRKRENVGYQEALSRAEEISGKSAHDVRGASGSSPSISRRERNRQGSRKFRRTWRSGQSDPGA